MKGIALKRNKLDLVWNYKPDQMNTFKVIYTRGDNGYSIGLIECTLQPRASAFNHIDIQMESHDLASMRALLECSFKIETFPF